jgi:hypothetical protein
MRRRKCARRQKILFPYTEPDRGRRWAFRSIGRSPAGAENRHERFIRLATRRRLSLDDANGTRGWLGLGSNRGWTWVACRAGGAYCASGTDCPHVAFVPFVALLTRGTRTLRSLWPLSASLTLSSRNPLQALGALRAGRP